MSGTYLLDKIEEALVVIARGGESMAVRWLSINAYACQQLGCTREVFLQHAHAQLDDSVRSWKGNGRSTLFIEGGETFDSCTFQFEYHADTFHDEECWILIGHFEEKARPAPVASLINKAVHYAISDAVIITDNDLNILDANQAALDLYGWEKQPPRGVYLGDAIPTKFPQDSREEILTHFRENGMWEGEVQQQNGNGEWVDIHASVNQVWDEQRSPIGVVTVNRNITPRKMAERALEISDQRLKLAGQAAYDLIYERDTLTGELHWYGDIEGLLGYKKGIIKNNVNFWLSLIHPDDMEVIEDALEHHRHLIEPIQRQYRVRHAEGHYRTWWDHAMPMLDEKGRPIKWVGVCADITHRVDVQNVLKERENLLSKIAENFPQAYLSVIFPDLTVGYTNGQAFKLQGIDPQQFVGLHIRDVFTPYGEEILGIITEAYQKTFAGEGQQFELNLGEEFQHYSTVPIEDESGNITRILVVARNITREKKREIRLKESEEKFSKAFRHHPVPMEILNVRTGVRVDINDSFVRLLGYDKEQLIGSNIHEFNIWPNEERRKHSLEMLKTHKKVKDFPLEMVDSKGRSRHLLISAAMLDVGQGDLAIVSLVDITLRKIAEESLRTSETHLLTLVNTLPDMVFLKDPEGKFIWCNQRFAELLDTNEAGVIGRTDYDFAAHDTADAYREEDARAIEAGKALITEEDFTIVKSGRIIRVETIKTPMYDSHGELVGVLGIARDITERVNQLEMLEQQNSALKNISWMQSHEVRAPLANIMGLISLMEGENPPTSHEQMFIYNEVINASHDLDLIVRRIIQETQEHLWAATQPEKEVQP